MIKRNKAKKSPLRSGDFFFLNNHSISCYSAFYIDWAVVLYVKDTKRKQITTIQDSNRAGLRLLCCMSKIQKESKSQPPRGISIVTFRCCAVCQRYKKKANHNFTLPLHKERKAVVLYVKDTKRKQITTPFSLSACIVLLLCCMSKIQKESKSQPPGDMQGEKIMLLCCMSKIQKESKSQLNPI